MKILSFALALLLALPVWATLPAGAVINIRSTATAGNLNGGGFNAARGGTNYTLQDAAQINGTDGTSNASTNFNSAAQTFTSQMVGNYLHLTAGTNGTAGWYEITAFVDANNVTLDRNCSTGAMTNGTFYVGGAMSLASTLDDDLFEAGVPGNIFYVKGAVTYTLGEAVSISAAGGASQPIIIRGYTTTQSDWTTTTGSNRPTFANAANVFTLGANWDTDGVIFTGTGTQVLIMGNNSKVSNLKVINSSTSAARDAIRGGTDFFVTNCEAVSYRGRAFFSNGNGGILQACWFHDSDIGVSDSGTTTVLLYSKNIIESNVTAAVSFSSARTARASLNGNTLFGSTNTTGIGVSIASGSTDIVLTNNIITGFVTGVSHADVQSVGYDNYNDYHNNDTDVTNWTKGTNDSAVAPSFSNVNQVTGATATTTAGNHLVQSGATFQTSGVLAGRDYVYVISGTGVTAGVYGIASVDSETQITTDITLSANATGDKVFQITTGHNFAIGSAMKALGTPGAFQGGYSTGYTDPGAVERQEPAGAGGTVAY